MSAPEWFEVITDAYLDDYDFEAGRWVPHLVASKGEIVCRYKGATYGVVTPDGVACCREHPLHTPFFEVPRDALRPVPSRASTQAGDR